MGEEEIFRERGNRIMVVLMGGEREEASWRGQRGGQWGRGVRTKSVAHGYKETMQSPSLCMLTKNVNVKRKKKEKRIRETKQRR